MQVPSQSEWKDYEPGVSDQSINQSINGGKDGCILGGLSFKHVQSPGLHYHMKAGALDFLLSPLSAGSVRGHKEFKEFKGPGLPERLKMPFFFFAALTPCELVRATPNTVLYLDGLGR